MHTPSHVARRSLALAALVLVAVVGAVASPASAVTNCSPSSSWGTNRADLATQVIGLINQYRGGKGLSQLAVSGPLTASSEWKSLHMAANGYFDHNDPAHRSLAPLTSAPRTVATAAAGGGKTSPGVTQRHNPSWTAGSAPRATGRTSRTPTSPPPAWASPRTPLASSTGHRVSAPTSPVARCLNLRRRLGRHRKPRTRRCSRSRRRQLRRQRPPPRRFPPGRRSRRLWRRHSGWGRSPPT